jgi:hypothetical protein
MSNHHLKDKALSLKSKGLLSQILSLPDDWNYNTRGLASINREGVDSIGTALKELELSGYLVRNQLRDERGRITDTEYVIYETPQTGVPDTPPPDTGKPYTVNPCTENAAVLNTYRERTQKSTPNVSNTHPSIRADATDTMDSRETYREMIKENIEYEHLCDTHLFSRDILAEILDLMVETVCSAKSTIRIGGEDRPAAVVRSRFLKIGSEHIAYVIERLSQNTTEVRNIRSYLLTSIYNAPATIGSYYQARVNHDLYGEEAPP